MLRLVAVLSILTWMAAELFVPSVWSAPVPLSGDSSRDIPAKMTGKDGAPMVLIPSGEFWMGSTPDQVDRVVKECEVTTGNDAATCQGWFQNEMPRHRVALNAFYLDSYEVTNRLFEKFVQATGYKTMAELKGMAKAWVEGEGLQVVKGANWRQPQGGQTSTQPQQSDHPVVSVSWSDADAYCRWAGKRLPTEAEWEYAARAGTQTRFWWGNGIPASRRLGNFADESAKHLVGGIVSGYDDGYIRTAPVGSYERNAWGLYDVIGNVGEWTADWYGGNYIRTPEQNPKGPSSGQFRVIRGGSWANGRLRIRSANRDWDTPTYRYDSIGFRCARDVAK
ncbi:MAG: formylglycine-generating enzyme family protein [Nitrospirae bacterium]|nr:MAG: formylglycine-generating enzyme family protein [Nitrospirota bacterium]